MPTAPGDAGRASPAGPVAAAHAKRPAASRLVAGSRGRRPRQHASRRRSPRSTAHHRRSTPRCSPLARPLRGTRRSLARQARRAQHDALETEPPAQPQASSCPRPRTRQPPRASRLPPIIAVRTRRRICPASVMALSEDGDGRPSANSRSTVPSGATSGGASSLARRRQRWRLKSALALTRLTAGASGHRAQAAQKTPLNKGILGGRRRGRDSNPRTAVTVNGFRDRDEHADLQGVFSRCASECASLQACLPG
jgi:hypothetical protein